MVEFDVHNLQKYKLGLHIAQATLIAFSWILEIVVFRKAKSIDGRPGWYFGMCFLSIPAIIFLTMTLRFPRTRKFANPYALATVDFLWAILWLSAFAAQASYNSSRKCTGACGASKAIVGFGVIIWFCWVITTIMSLYGVMYWSREGYLPGASRAPYNAQSIDPDKEAFSTAPHDDDYAPVQNTDDQDAPDHEGSRYGARTGSQGSRFGASSPSFGGGYVPPSVSDEPSVYTGYSGAASVHSGTGGRVHFPDARYDNVTVLN